MKPQQQTLSIRISESLREYLERAKQVISNGRDEFFSISDVAKMLLESPKDDRLDFRLEVADLQKDATESMANIRTKWKRHQGISRAEWIFVAQYGCTEREAHAVHGRVGSIGRAGSLDTGAPTSTRQAGGT